MVRTTLRLVTLTLAFTACLACAKSKSDAFREDGKAPFDESSWAEIDPAPSRSSAPAPKDLRRLLGSASALMEEATVPDEPPAEAPCPATKDWQKFDTFAASCGYVWTIDTDKLPPALQWRACTRSVGVPSAMCRQSTRGRRIKAFHVGTSTSKEMLVGFVESCPADQVVLTDTDGKPLFAFRRAEDAPAGDTCPVKLLDVDLGSWLVALGTSERPKDLDTAGYTQGGGFVGGDVGIAPSILFSTTTEPFHVATSHGQILVDGFSADGKRRDWKGKPLEKPPRLGLQRVTKHLVFDPQKGFYSTTSKDLKPVWEVSKGHTIGDVQVRDQQIVWRDELYERGRKQCTLFAGDLDAREILSGARPIAEMPCGVTNVAWGCSSVLIEYETHLSLISLASGSARVLRIKGHPAAVHCKEVFVEQNGALLRLDLAAFGATKVPPLLPTDVPESIQGH